MEDPAYGQAPMTNALTAILTRTFDDALGALRGAVEACPDAVWETDLWPQEAPTARNEHGGLHGSAPWFLAYHALSCLDYDLLGESERWDPPPPFDTHIWGFPSRVHARADLLAYIEYCRERVRATIAALTGDVAMQPLPAAHRYAGTPYGVMIGGIPLHVVEHATQIRAFVAAAAGSAES